VRINVERQVNLDENSYFSPAFLVAWTPYSVFALIEQFGDPSLITPAFAVLPALIAKSSICYNPLIYVGMNSQV
jgi:c-opsin